MLKPENKQQLVTGIQFFKSIFHLYFFIPQVLILRELAICVPTYFFQKVQNIIEPILRTVRDPKPSIRENAVEALRATLVITAQRETTKQMLKPLWLVPLYK